MRLSKLLMQFTFDYGQPALYAWRNAETSKKLNMPSPEKSAIGSIELYADRNAETSKKLSIPSPFRSARQTGASW